MEPPYIIEAEGIYLKHTHEPPLFSPHLGFEYAREVPPPFTVQIYFGSNMELQGIQLTSVTVQIDELNIEIQNDISDGITYIHNRKDLSETNGYGYPKNIQSYNYFGQIMAILFSLDDILNVMPDELTKRQLFNRFKKVTRLTIILEIDYIINDKMERVNFTCNYKVKTGMSNAWLDGLMGI
jgi:hypothetical protein